MDVRECPRLDKSFAASETQEELKVGQKLRAAGMRIDENCVTDAEQPSDIANRGEAT